MTTKQAPIKIAIIGGGFAGTALVAALNRLNTKPCEVVLFEKSGKFAAGEAYRTPFPFHILNVKARDMSAFEDEPDHYVKWLSGNSAITQYLDTSLPIAEQYTSRIFYGTYLKYLLERATHLHRLTLEPTEVTDVKTNKTGTVLMLKDGREIKVDKVVFATGNYASPDFPFPVAEEIKSIRHSWDYFAPVHIQSDATVMIVGTGLSMVDAVQTLHQRGHRGKIYAVSRHGLLPLSHADSKVPFTLGMKNLLKPLRELTRMVRKLCESHMKAGGDWRTVISTIRPHVPAIWAQFSTADKRRFMRHLATLWNIHRHRVHPRIVAMLNEMQATEQLTILAGRVLAVDAEYATIQDRHTGELIQFPVTHLISCMGPANMGAVEQPLIQALRERQSVGFDVFGLGFDVTATGALKSVKGEASTIYYTLGSARRGAVWESSAVPEIRQQAFELAKVLLGASEKVMPSKGDKNVRRSKNTSPCFA